MGRKKKYITAYAAYDWRGNLLAATLRPSYDEAQELLHRFNPLVAGFDYPYEIRSVDLDKDQNIQYRLPID